MTMPRPAACRVPPPVTALVLTIALVTGLAGADWRQFRGNDSSSVAPGEKPPVAWGQTENIAWKIPLSGRGLSGPIVVGDRVYLTSSDGFDQDRLLVECYDVKTGVRRWRRTFRATGRTQCHSKMANATPTPASDGKRIFAFYSSNDLVCLDLDGNLLWYRGLTHDYPNASNSLGMASSPVVIGDTVIVQVESQSESFATGLDVATGTTRWHRKQHRFDNWSSPIALTSKDPAKSLVLLQNMVGLTALDARTGHEAWHYDQPASRTPSSVVANGTVYIPSNGLTVVRPTGTDKKTLEIAWKDNRFSSGTPSPLVYRGKVFTMSGPIVKCGDATTGKLLWQLRLKGAFTSSPVAANGHLYYFGETGMTYVVDINGPKGKIVAENELGATILCTPAIANNSVFVRSDGHLWKISR